MASLPLLKPTAPPPLLHFGVIAALALKPALVNLFPADSTPVKRVSPPLSYISPSVSTPSFTPSASRTTPSVASCKFGPTPWLFITFALITFFIIISFSSSPFPPPTPPPPPPPRRGCSSPPSHQPSPDGEEAVWDETDDVDDDDDDDGEPGDDGPPPASTAADDHPKDRKAAFDWLFVFIGFFFSFLVLSTTRLAFRLFFYRLRRVVYHHRRVQHVIDTPTPSLALTVSRVLSNISPTPSTVAPPSCSSLLFSYPRECYVSEIPSLVEDITAYPAAACTESSLVLTKYSTVAPPSCSVLPLSFPQECFASELPSLVEDVATLLLSFVYTPTLLQTGPIVLNAEPTLTAQGLWGWCIVLFTAAVFMYALKQGVTTKSTCDIDMEDTLDTDSEIIPRGDVNVLEKSDGISDLPALPFQTPEEIQEFNEDHDVLMVPILIPSEEPSFDSLYSEVNLALTTPSPLQSANGLEMLSGSAKEDENVLIIAHQSESLETNSPGEEVTLAQTITHFIRSLNELGGFSPDERAGLALAIAILAQRLEMLEDNLRSSDEETGISITICLLCQMFKEISLYAPNEEASIDEKISRLCQAFKDVILHSSDEEAGLSLIISVLTQRFMELSPYFPEEQAGIPSSSEDDLPLQAAVSSNELKAEAVDREQISVLPEEIILPTPHTGDELVVVPTAVITEQTLLPAQTVEVQDITSLSTNSISHVAECQLALTPDSSAVPRSSADDLALQAAVSSVEVEKGGVDPLPPSAPLEDIPITPPTDEEVVLLPSEDLEIRPLREGTTVLSPLSDPCLTDSIPVYIPPLVADASSVLETVEDAEDKAPITESTNGSFIIQSVTFPEPQTSLNSSHDITSSPPTLAHTISPWPLPPPDSVLLDNRVAPHTLGSPTKLWTMDQAATANSPGSVNPDHSLKATQPIQAARVHSSPYPLAPVHLCSPPRFLNGAPTSPQSPSRTSRPQHHGSQPTVSSHPSLQPSRSETRQGSSPWSETSHSHWNTKRRRKSD